MKATLQVATSRLEARWASGAVRFEPYALGKSLRHDLFEFVTNRTGAGFEGFTGFNGADEVLAASIEADVGVRSSHKAMGEQAQCLDGGDTRITLPQCLRVVPRGPPRHGRRTCPPCGGMVEDGHPPDLGGGCDLVNGHVIEAALEEKMGRDIRNALSQRFAFPGAKVRGG
ncbi:MAG: hypothetical protein QM755_19215 [Luteolibacter sp.]